MSSTIKATFFGAVALVVFISLLSIPYSSDIKRVFILNTSLREPWFLEIQAVVNNLSRTSNDMLFPTFASLLNQTWERNRTLLTCYREALKASANMETSNHLLLTLQNIHRGQSLPTIDDKKVKPTRTMFKYFPKESPLPHPSYNSCSIVGSSAILSGSQCGSRIDDANIIFRLNLAPTVGFEKDVGKRTTMSTMNPSIFKNKFGNKKTLKNVKEFSTLLREHDNELIWTPAFAYEGNSKPTFDAIKKVREINPKLQFVLQDTRHFIALRTFWKSYGLDAMLSSGFYFISTALDICENVNAYGFWPFDKAMDNRSLTYHYFDDGITFNKHHEMNQEFAILVAMHNQGLLRLNIGKC